MTKAAFRILLAVVAIAVFSSVAFADFTGPFYDTFVIVNNTNNPAAPNLSVQDSTGSCTDTHITYFQFDVSGIGTVDSAQLTVKAGGTPVGLDYSPTMTMYGVADFDPNTLNGSNYPLTSAGVVIQSQTIPASTVAGNVFVWGGSDPGLKNYVQSQADGDNIVTLAFSFSLNCHPVNSSLSFYSQDWGTPADRPVLTITGTKPNSVTLRTFRSDNSVVSPVILAGAGIALLAGVVGIIVARRRRLAN